MRKPVKKFCFEYNDCQRKLGEDVTMEVSANQKEDDWNLHSETGQILKNQKIFEVTIKTQNRLAAFEEETVTYPSYVEKKSETKSIRKDFKTKETWKHVKCDIRN